MNEHRSLTVPEGAAGSRVDRFVADATGFSRAHVQRLIAEGLLTVDGQRLRARDPVRAGWQLELEVPETASDEPLPEDIPLTVVYRDDDVLVVDKPAGLVTHPAPGHRSGTLVNALLGLAAAEDRRYGPETDEPAIDEADRDVEAGTAEVGGGAGAATERAGIVHRLDRDTSGLLMVARNPSAHVALQAQLKARRVRKTYLGLVGGVVNAQLGRIEKPIGRDPRTRLRMAVTAEGRPAVTGYRVRERFGEWTLLELDLVTGRTHQIRVHLASIGHAVAGDPVYATGATRRGPDGLTRLFLHAWKLEFVSPGSGRLVRCEAPLPDDLEGALESLRAAASGRA
jgi:23S rRNA pseudouridine1911/1915/1917 synthase